mmetsp:Transcript_94433/g.224975  ORF Transcript_94433/g.224975 Transcript_94433/m.224975 type:complete len:265 (-) Transcript_94433:2061-2855(-)
MLRSQQLHRGPVAFALCHASPLELVSLARRNCCLRGAPACPRHWASSRCQPGWLRFARWPGSKSVPLRPQRTSTSCCERSLHPLDSEQPAASASQVCDPGQVQFDPCQRHRCPSRGLRAHPSAREPSAAAMALASASLADDRQPRGRRVCASQVVHQHSFQKEFVLLAVLWRSLHQRRVDVSPRRWLPAARALPQHSRCLLDSSRSHFGHGKSAARHWTSLRTSKIARRRCRRSPPPEAALPALRQAWPSSQAAGAGRPLSAPA